MFRTVEGIYRNGDVHLEETPDGAREGMRVLVTFLTPIPVDLAARGVDPASAAALRAHLATFAEEWDSSEMDIYDEYDAVHTGLPAR
jgi:hypothetical protein